MQCCAHLQLLAEYNRWMNQNVYEAAAKLPLEEIHADRKAFFKSIIGTLNHLLVADLIWLRRFANHPALAAAKAAMDTFPGFSKLDDVLIEDFARLHSERQRLDQVIQETIGKLQESDLEQTLHYHTLDGQPMQKNMFALLLHFFNHQTHHRGQTTTLLTQAGVDVGATDLNVIIPQV